MDEYVNMTTYGSLSWTSISSCALDSEEGIQHWQQKMHEVYTRRCARITRSLLWIGMELCDPPMYDELTDIGMFIKEFES